MMVVCFVCAAKEVIIQPEFNVGETFEYKVTTELRLCEGQDSAVVTSVLLPKFVVEGHNDKGFILKASNKREAFNITFSRPELKGASDSFIGDEVKNLITPLVLTIQLDADNRLDSILNITEVKKSILKTYYRIAAKELGPDTANTETWKVTQALLELSIETQYNQEKLIARQFGNIPYFNFIGTPLESGKIPASMVLCDELDKFCFGATELNMEISPAPKKDRTDTYVIKVNGKKDNSIISCEFLFINGLMNLGTLSVYTEIDRVTIASTFHLERLP